jgi:hypothetical protein
MQGRASAFTDFWLGDRLPKQKPQSYPFGSSAVLRVLRGVVGGRRGGSEDPWLCGPGFRRVCLYRGSTATLRGGTTAVNTAAGVLSLEGVNALLHRLNQRTRREP